MSNNRLSRRVTAAVLATGLIGVTWAWPIVPASGAGPNGTVDLSVISAYDSPVKAPFRDTAVAKGEVVTEFDWQINEDSIGDVTFDPGKCLPPNAADAITPTAGSAGFPDACGWPSVRAIDGQSQIVASGNQDDAANLTLPNGKYLVSVTADGFKIDGAHFTVDGDTAAGADQVVVVQMNPLPVPSATIRVNVFNDNASTNGQYDGVPENTGDMSGFSAQLNDIAGEVAFDVYGNPLCTEYQTDVNGIIFDADGSPLPAATASGGATGGGLAGSETTCISDINGDIVIPNVGPNRYAVTVSPPDHQTNDEARWIQTTTLEGGPDWDTWNMEGATGFDTELVVGGESVPFVHFGFVKQQPMSPLPVGTVQTGSISGRMMVGRTYVAQTTGLPNPGNIWGGGTGTLLERPVEDGWVSLACLAGCAFPATDTAVYVQPAATDGNFTIPNVPPGTYTLTMWDEAQERILDMVQVTVGTTAVDVGVFPLAGWFTDLTGSVFLDRNGNGRRDGVGTANEEPGIPNFGLTLRTRVNTLQDQGAASALTTDDGEWSMAAYPLGQFLILEAYHPAYKTTGMTWKLGNESTSHTQLTDQVDWNVLNIFGLGGHFDVGVLPYGPDENGGIVGTVQYDVTRNELNPRNAAAEDWQPGVPDMTMQLWRPGTTPGGANRVVPEGEPNAGAIVQLCADGSDRPFADYGTVDAPGGCDPIEGLTTEKWTRPTGCTARTANGSVAYSQALPTPTTDSACFEAPMMGVQLGTNGEVDGNYGFGDLVSGDYLVEAISPTDAAFAALNGRDARPIYTFTDETSINVFTGDTYRPQGDYTSNGETAGPASALPASGYPENTVDSACAGRLHQITVTDQDFLDNGGSPAEGELRPYCDVKLVRVQPRRSIAPIFHVFTRVPIPTRFVGYIIDDLSVSTNPKSTVFGEKAGMSNVPVGIYDYTGRLVYTAESDYNGYYEALLPSTGTIACPTPSGVCPNVYRLVGNDPGQVGAPNLNYNPQYRTIGTEFQGWPGVVHPVDQAPTRIAASFQLPGSQQLTPPVCAVPAGQSEFYRISQPYGLPGSTGYTVTGKGFGATAGSLVLGGNSIPTLTWTDTSITFDLPANAPMGASTLRIIGSNGQAGTNGVTFHVLGGTYNPQIIEVGTGKAFDPADDPADGSGPRAIQKALDAADASATARGVVVVVYPNMAPGYEAFNPDRAYFENLVMHSAAKLQGVGPGGPGVPGSRVDGRYFWTVNALGDIYAETWRVATEALPVAGNPTVTNGQVIYVRPERTNQFNGTFTAAIDGFTITGGDQQGFPTNLNFLGGGNNGTPRPGVINVETQGGGVFLNAYARNTQISNNVFVSNGGTIGGAIRVGSPELGTTQATSSSFNTGVKILRNRVIANGGTMFAGAIGIFYGSNNYEIADNDICGNASAEYGGGISHYGRSPGGRIHHNRIINNQAYDEAGGIMIAGELPRSTTTLSTGAGPVTIDHNVIEANLANDDGGGVRFLMAAGSQDDLMEVSNNIIANNVSTHEGGGISIDDTPNLRVINNTIVKNITTATAMTSTGLPAPAGLSTSANSALLQASLNRRYGNRNSPKFSNPVLLNNIFADNRAGTWTNNGVVGIGAAGDLSPVLRWDVGTNDGSGTPTVYGSITDSAPSSPAYKGGTGYTLGAGSNNIQVGASSGIGAIGFALTYDSKVLLANWRTFPNFRPAAIVTLERPIGELADYHLGNPRPATEIVVDLALAASPAVVPYGVIVAPATDIDDSARVLPYDKGADENVPKPAAPPLIAPPPPPPPPTPPLDAFNRPAAPNLRISPTVTNWTQSALMPPFGVDGTAAVAQTSMFGSGIALWNPTGSVPFGPSQFAGFVVAGLPDTASPTSSIGVVLKRNGTGVTERFVEARYTHPTGAMTTGTIQIGFTTTGAGNVAWIGAAIPATLAVGDVFYAQVNSGGIIEVRHNGAVVGTRAIPVSAFPGWTAANNANGGRIGMRYQNTGLLLNTKVDDFRGGTL